MQQPFEDIPLPPPPRRGFDARLALFSFAFTSFVLGGVLFGWLFLANWKMLAQFRASDVGLTGGGSVSVPIRPDLGGTAQGAPTPAAPAGETTPRVDLPEWTGNSRVNIMLLGVDRRDDEPVDGSRADTTIIVSIDPATRAVVMISLPRDLYVEIPGHPNQRINAAHVLGGPTLLARTVERNFGITVHNYARIDFRGFERIVDALDGVIVDVERTIKDDEYPTEDYGIMRLFIPPGPQLMDGKLALQYARSRHGDTDFGRGRRQQRLLLAMRERGLQMNVLPRMPSLVDLVQKAIQTDIGVSDMLRLARLGSQIERDRVKSVVVDVTLADPFLGPYGEDLLAPRRGDIRRAIERGFAEATGQWARVEVLNGTPREGIAFTLGEQLKGAGYEVVRVAPADRTDYRDTSIVVLNGNQTAATTLAARLRLPPTAVQAAPTPDPSADVRIILGGSFRP